MVQDQAQTPRGRGRDRGRRLRNYVWPDMGWRRYLIFLGKRILRLKTTPHAVGAGVASGAAVSMFPLIGLHFILGFVLAYFTRGNMIAAAIGTAWGNPLTFPIFFAASYGVGSWMLGLAGVAPVDAAALSGDELRQGLFAGGFATIWPAFKTMLIGAIPIALAVYAAFYVVVRWLVGRFQTARQARIAERRRQRQAGI